MLTIDETDFASLSYTPSLLNSSRILRSLILLSSARRSISSSLVPTLDLECRFDKAESLERCFFSRLVTLFNVLELFLLLISTNFVSASESDLSPSRIATSLPFPLCGLTCGPSSGSGVMVSSSKIARICAASAVVQDGMCSLDTLLPELANESAGRGARPSGDGGSRPMQQLEDLTLEGILLQNRIWADEICRDE